MNTEQALKEITKYPKWYAVTQETKEQTKLRMQAKRIQAGTAKRITIIKFMKAFGYECVKVEEQWEKK